MAKIKLTKNELKKQKDQLKMFKRYLPTLTLKKQQLQAEIRGARDEYKRAKEAYDELLHGFDAWVGVFGEELDLPDGLFTLKSLEIERGNIAGVDIPLYKEARFEAAGYDLFAVPLWADKAAAHMQKAMELDIRVKVAEKKTQLLERELAVTSQRVNLFEKVKIPETKGHIKKIEVFLGDEQTAAVVRGKISKKKLSQMEES